MQGYIEITSQEQFNAVLEDVDYLHDGLLKEIHLINRAHRTDTGSVLTYWLDAQVFIQAKKPVEFAFSNVLAISMDDIGAGEIEQIIATVKPVSLPYRQVHQAITLGGSSFSITAERVFYRSRPDWLGKQARLTSEVATIDAIPASRLEVEGNWRQCSNCLDAWQEAEHIQFSLCPSCEKMTELDESR
jgi:hypothetical protein